MSDKKKREERELSSLGLNLSTVLSSFVEKQGYKGIEAPNNAIIGDCKKLGLLDANRNITPFGKEIIDKSPSIRTMIPYTVLCFSLDGEKFPILDFFHWLYEQWLNRVRSTNIDGDSNNFLNGSRVREVHFSKDDLLKLFTQKGYSLGNAKDRTINYVMSYIAEMFSSEYNLANFFELKNERNSNYVLHIKDEMGFRLLKFWSCAKPNFSSVEEYLNVLSSAYSLEKILRLLGKL